MHVSLEHEAMIVKIRRRWFENLEEDSEEDQKHPKLGV